MRTAFFSLALTLFFATFAMAIAPHKSVIISYPKDTPWSVVDAAKDKIRESGGEITHEYNIIKGFSAQAPASVFESVQALSSDATIEEDGVVTTQTEEK